MSLKPYPAHPILLVDDDLMILKSFEIALEHAGFTNFIRCSDSHKVPELLKEQKVLLILLDLNMPVLSGEELLEHIVSEYPDVPVIVITGNNEVKTAVTCMKQGAYDYLVKPVGRNRLISIVQKAIKILELQHENLLLKQRILDSNLIQPEAFSHMITRNMAMQAIFTYTESIATSPQPLLITGETGVGKELMARAAHTVSNRNGEFVVVNVAGIDDNAFSDTLFGHVRGAFTGADTQRPGLVEKAEGGTLVLDEIGDLSKESQVKLLRLIQEREYYPLGADEPKTSDARIIVCTNINLKKAQEEGTFRKDLYYRLQAHCIELPPLRMRKEDLDILIEHFLDEAAQLMQKNRPSYPAQLLDLLNQYDFPGNVRELQAMVFDAVGKATTKTLSLESFYNHLELHKSQELSTSEQKSEVTASSPFNHHPLPTLKEANKLLISEALKRANNNQSMAARMLGISRQTLARNLQATK